MKTVLHDHLFVRKICVCCTYIAQSLTQTQKMERVKWSNTQLKRFNRGTSNLVYNIITGDETWIYVHAFESERKRQSMEWV